jgi:glycosyltransferase involved in cell wall biosynthesis
MSLDISIVVCTHNRAAMLREALASLHDLATDGCFSYEVVVVDNASTDHTADVIAVTAAGAKHPLRGVREAEKGIVPARNRGIREARGRWIAFFDDDQLADSRWLAELYHGAQQRKCRVAGGAVHLASPPGCTLPLDPTLRMLLGESILSDQPLRYGGRNTPGCGNLMVERSVFDQVGMFQPAAGGRGEDTDLFMRMDKSRIAAWYLPTAIIHHLTPPERLEAKYLLNLARRMGEGIALRQAQQLGPVRFGFLWLAKATRVAALHYPRQLLAQLSGDAEAALGSHCLVEINLGFLRAGCGCLQSGGTRTGLAASKPAAAPALSGIPGK